MMLIVRREQGALRRYAHLSTGNYHQITSRIYTDFGLMTANPDIGEDAHLLFLQLSGLGPIIKLKCLLHSPFTLHKGLKEKIEREIAHGDTLCTDDAPYQAFRAQSRDPKWQRAFLARPVTERQAFAAQARAESQRYTHSAGDAITDVNKAEVTAALHAHGVRRLIHGHTHRPAIHGKSPRVSRAERLPPSPLVKVVNQARSARTIV